MIQAVINANELRAALSRLNELPEECRNIKPLIKKASMPILMTAKRLAPIQTGFISDAAEYKHRAGTLKRSLDFIPHKYANFVIIGPRVRWWGKARGAYEDGFYASWVEFGHMSRSGTNVEAQPFMRPAFDQHKGQVVENVKNALAKKIARWAKRNAK